MRSHVNETGFGFVENSGYSARGGNSQGWLFMFQVI